MMNEYMKRVLKLKEKYANDMEKIADEMEAENEILRKSLEKTLSIYCRTRAIKVRKHHTNDERFGSVNSYPESAWRDFLESGYIE